MAHRSPRRATLETADSAIDYSLEYDQLPASAVMADRKALLRAQGLARLSTAEKGKGIATAGYATLPRWSSVSPNYDRPGRRYYQAEKTASPNYTSYSSVWEEAP